MLYSRNSVLASRSLLGSLVSAIIFSERVAQERRAQADITHARMPIPSVQSSTSMLLASPRPHHYTTLARLNAGFARQKVFS